MTTMRSHAIGGRAYMIQADAVCPAQKTGQRAHVLAGEAQAERVRPQQPIARAALQIAHFQRRVGREANDGARNLLTL